MVKRMSRKAVQAATHIQLVYRAKEEKVKQTISEEYKEAFLLFSWLDLPAFCVHREASLITM